MTESSASEAPEPRIVICASCGVECPIDAPCNNDKCPANIAAQIRLAALKSPFRLGL